MATVREQQIEALRDAADYMDRLIPSMEQVIAEIKGTMQEDTIDFLHQVVDGLNFMIETYNVTRDVLNSDGELINDDVFEECVGNLSDGFSKRNYEKIADVLSESIVPFLKVFREAARRKTA